jgi:uncharacterized repeat protein (TIGR01451 family)
MLKSLTGLLAAMLVALSAIAQEADTTAWITNGDVRAIVRKGNTLYMGGSFTGVGPVTGTGTTLHLGNGGLAAARPLRITGPVVASVSDGMGGWFVGGEFTKIGGQVRKKLSHVLADGSLDANWDARITSDSVVIYALAFANNTLYVGGFFQSIGGQNRAHLAALDGHTGMATAWNPNPNGIVGSLALSENTLYVGGNFTAMGAQFRRYLAAVDAVTGTIRAWNPLPDNSISDLLVSGNTVYVAGYFEQIGGGARKGLAALDATTGKPNSWNPYPNDAAYTLTLAGNTLYVGGRFDAIGGQLRSRVASFDVQTGQITPWNPNPNGPVSTVAVSGGVVYLGGLFNRVGAQARNNLAAVDASTGKLTDWNAEANASVYTLCISGSTLFAGGTFTAGGMQLRNGLAALNASTGQVTAWNPKPELDYYNGRIHALAVAGGKVYVGGNFSAIGGQPRRSLAAVDTLAGAATPWIPSPVGSVYALAVAGNKLYLGGSFNELSGQPRGGLAAIDVTTDQLTPWNPRVSDYSTVNIVAVRKGIVYAGGNFTTVNGQPRNFLAAMQGTTGEVTAWNPGPLSGSGVAALAFYGDTVYVGGSYFTYGSKYRRYLGAFHATTGATTDWYPNISHPVSALAVSDGLLLVGGSFLNFDNQSRRHLAAVDIFSTRLVAWNPSPDGAVHTLIAYERALYAGGLFQTMQGRLQPYFAAFRQGTPWGSFVKGTVYEDADGNCVKSAGEKGIAGRVVVAQPGNYFSSADSLGNYTIRIDTGRYTVAQVLPANLVDFTRVVCPLAPALHGVRFTRYDSTVAGKDFGNQTIIRPHLSVAVSSDRRRRCFTSHTSVSYCNEGTATAQNVQVHLQLPEYVALVSAGHSYTKDRDGNYVFNIGAVEAGACGKIQLVDSVICNDPNIRGLTQCTRAWITPANTRTPGPGWDGSDVTLKARCGNNGRVRLALYNTGTGPMADSSAYRVYLDAQLAFTRNFKLAKGDSLILHLPANGRTVRLEADQRPAHPDKRQSNITIEACGTNNGGKVSKGYVCQFPQDDEEPEVAIQCLPIIDSFDPNDKAVSPEGVTDQHYTPTGRALDYVVRFQNTGTAVAYEVVVVDTLSEHLDISTLRVGAVSHPYKLSVSGKGRPVLTFTFNNINLPDSNANEPASHGRIQFSIRPKAGLPEKTRVENFADIFFDYNEPIRTNTTLNTIYDLPPVVAADVALAPGDVCLNGNVAVRAGANRTVCAQDTLRLGAGPPPEGSGRWKLVSGAGAIREGNRPDATVTGLAYGDNVFEWRIPASSCGGDSLAASVTITRLEKPVPVITQLGADGLVCSVTGSRYDWFLDGVKLDQAGRQIRVSQPGRYTVRVEMPTGCHSDPSEAYAYGVTGLGPGAPAAVRIFPNPTPGRLVIALPVSQSGPVDVLVVNKIGRTVLKQTFNPAGGAGEFHVELDLSAQATGLYVIKLQTGKSLIVRSVFKK